MPRGLSMSAAQRDRIVDDYLPKELLPLITSKPAATCIAYRLADFGYPTRDATFRVENFGCANEYETYDGGM